MPTTIRLKRVGRKKQPSYRIVVTDSQRAVSGRSIERLGIYNPRTEPSLLKLDAVRTIHWLREGAEPSHTVRSLLRRCGVWEKFHAGLTPEQVAVTDEAEILLGPPSGGLKTSRRPLPERAEKPEREASPAPTAEAEVEAEAATSEAGPEAATAEAEPEAATAEAEPEAAAAEAEPEAATAEAEVEAAEAEVEAATPEEEAAEEAVAADATVAEETEVKAEGEAGAETDEAAGTEGEEEEEEEEEEKRK